MQNPTNCQTSYFHDFTADSHKTSHFFIIFIRTLHPSIDEYFKKSSYQ